MLDLWSVGAFGAFVLIAALVYRSAMGPNARDARKERCVSRMLADQIGSERR